MANQRVQRRLAAILAADVVGYSVLMAMDEEATLAARSLPFERKEDLNLLLDGLRKTGLPEQAPQPDA